MIEANPVWNPEAFRDAVQASGLSYTDIAMRLHGRGVNYSIESLRAWSRPGSAGPKHSVVVWTLREILPGL